MVRKIKRKMLNLSKPVFNLKILVLLVFLVLNVNGNVINEQSNNFSSELKSKNLVENIKQIARLNLINEVDKFIDSLAPTNTLSPEHLVNICNKYNLDITFVLAQGLLESHFGTRGKATQTNSIFNVGTYDNGQILYRYSDPNESIEPYAILLVKRYLVNKTEEHLLKDKGYTNVYGQRFASAKRYEASLRTLMVKINMNTSISLFQEITKMDNESILKFFGPKEKEKYQNFYAMN